MHFWMCFHCFRLPQPRYLLFHHSSCVENHFILHHMLAAWTWARTQSQFCQTSRYLLRYLCTAGLNNLLVHSDIFFPMSLCIGALPPPKKTSTLCVALLRMWIFYLPIRPQCWFSQFNQHWQKTIGTKRFTKTILYDWDVDCLGTSINFWTTSSSSPTPFLPSRILSNLIEKCFSL